MGSAMNDTTRELGGSLGVAVFGSLLASRYAHGLAEVLGQVPSEARETVSGSLSGALRVSGAAGDAGTAVADAARTAWVSGFQFSLMVAAVVVGVAGAVAWRFLPDRAVDLPMELDLSDDELANVAEHADAEDEGALAAPGPAAPAAAAVPVPAAAAPVAAADPVVVESAPTAGN